MSIEYGWASGCKITDELCAKCSRLYSSDYGTWSTRHPTKAGARIKLSANRIREWLAHGAANLYYAHDEDELVGYAIAVQIPLDNNKPIIWVTQLVVAESYRNQGVAKTMLYSIWGMTSQYAWGIVTSNPYAVRALEKVTRRRCDLGRINAESKLLKRVALEHIPYIDEGTEIVTDSNCSVVNTRFFAQHDDLPEKIERACKDGVPWLLGELEEGWEWLAFTFASQKPMDLTADEVAEMLRCSDDIVRTAYSKMGIEQGVQPWMRHTQYETELSWRLCGLNEGDSVLDVGCGAGRHALSLCKHGAKVTGVDYVERSIDRAKEMASGICGCTFECADILEYRLKKQYDAVFCLYDVIGSYADDDKNKRIADMLFQALKPGGRALVSVMNYSAVAETCENTFSFSLEPSRVLHMEASDTMERTGNVFDPNYMLLDTEKHVVYRREQFRKGDTLPMELIVRDRRYTADEICELCGSVGFEVLLSRYVHAGDWETELQPTDESAKEILVLLRKPE